MLSASVMIPVFGQVTALNTRFVFGMARTIMKQRCSRYEYVIVRASSQEHQNSDQLLTVLYVTLLGIEFLNDSSQALFKGS